MADLDMSCYGATPPEVERVRTKLAALYPSSSETPQQESDRHLAYLAGFDLSSPEAMLSSLTEPLRQGGVEEVKRWTAMLNTTKIEPDNHPLKPLWLDNVGPLLRETWGGGQDHIKYLNLAIAFQHNTVELTPSDHPEKPDGLDEFAESPNSRWRRLREMADINRAIGLREDAVKLIPADHPDKQRYIEHLGSSHYSRWEPRLGNNADLDRAITLREDAVKLVPDDHLQKPMYLSSLGFSFHARW
jgi:hypothetical protein